MLIATALTSGTPAFRIAWSQITVRRDRPRSTAAWVYGIPSASRSEPRAIRAMYGTIASTRVAAGSTYASACSPNEEAKVSAVALSTGSQPSSTAKRNSRPIPTTNSGRAAMTTEPLSSDRSEERRVGKEGRCRRAREHGKEREEEQEPGYGE